jgi:excisionase family DNA binding protein
MGVPVLIDSDQLDALNSKLDRVLAELDAMRRPTSKAVGTGEAAEILGVSESTLRRLDADGAMPRKVNTGKHARYNRADIERMAQARKTGRPRKTAQTS